MQGELKPIKGSSATSKEIDIYEVVALAKRLNISLEEIKDMSFISLMNILISSVQSDEDNTATQEDIDRMFG